MKILYYNWIQFDNAEKLGGGVNVYQSNLVEYFVSNTDHEIYFVSSGWHYNPLKPFPYIRKTKNIHKKKCKTFEIVNSPIMAPAFSIFMNPEKFIKDQEIVEIFDKFIQKYGIFDVVHFNNIEGISINTLELKKKYPGTKFIVSIHNYQPLCPLNQLFQNHKECICHDFGEGRECLHCAVELPSGKEYCRRSRVWLLRHFPKKPAFLQFPIKVLCKFFNYRTPQYIGSRESMHPEWYAAYRKRNIEFLNKYADSILAVSGRVREILIDHGVDAAKVKTCYIGTKFAEKALKHSAAAAAQPFTIAYLGYERMDKGFFFLMDALATLDADLAGKINVILAVTNIHRENVFPSLAKYHDVKIYNGYRHDQLQDILADVNLGIVPVLWEDNLPQVAIEMVACGVPILCSSFGGASELCRSDLFKFQGGNVEDFLKHLTLLSERPELLNEYWKNHQPLTNMEKHSEQLISVYCTQNGEKK